MITISILLICLGPKTSYAETCVNLNLSELLENVTDQKGYSVPLISILHGLYDNANMLLSGTQKICKIAIEKADFNEKIKTTLMDKIKTRPVLLVIGGTSFLILAIKKNESEVK